MRIARFVLNALSCFEPLSPNLDDPEVTRSPDPEDRGRANIKSPASVSMFIRGGIENTANPGYLELTSIM